MKADDDAPSYPRDEIKDMTRREWMEFDPAESRPGFALAALVSLLLWIAFGAAVLAIVSLVRMAIEK